MPSASATFAAMLSLFAVGAILFDVKYTHR
jgi:hypothetical protein